MELVFAPDSFKGSLSAVQIVKLLEVEARQVFPDARIHSIPIADGGEGTVEALLLAMGGKRQTVEVSNPLGDKTQAVYGIMPNGTAVMEMAQASGITLIKHKDPFKASSRGTGEMIADALHRGIRRIMLGIGGSATNDGGMGMLAALGVRFLDSKGNIVLDGGGNLHKIISMDTANMMPELLETHITVICDVSNPLLGAQGATAVYGPQKGVTPELFPALEAGMTQYAGVLEQHLGKSFCAQPGCGAGGGIGAALLGVLGAEMKSGIHAVLDLVEFDRMLLNADLVVTGEGCMDQQTATYGKVVAGIAERAKGYNVPVCAIVGSMRPGAEALLEHFQDFSAVTTVNGIMPLDYAMEHAEQLYREAAKRMFRFISMGQRIQSKARLIAGEEMMRLDKNVSIEG